MSSDIERTGFTPCPAFDGEVDEFGVGAWVPTADGSGKPEMVILHMKLRLPILGKMQIGLRLQTKDVAEKLITMLREMTDEVWPPT